jgi:hypothetical protein
MRTLCVILFGVFFSTGLFYIAGAFVAGDWNSGHWDVVSKLFLAISIIIVHFVMVIAGLVHRKEIETWFRTKRAQVSAANVVPIVKEQDNARKG